MSPLFLWQLHYVDSMIAAESKEPFRMSRQHPQCCKIVRVFTAHGERRPGAPVIQAAKDAAEPRGKEDPMRFCFKSLMM